MWCFGKSFLDFTRPYLFHSNSELGDLGLVRGRCRIHLYHDLIHGRSWCNPEILILVLFMLSLLQNVPRAIR